jgi:hypothetical protein
MTPEKVFPGATAIATGAKDALQAVFLFGDYISALPLLAIHWGGWS